MLDTNAVLDWLLFGDPVLVPVAAAVATRRVRWVATTGMRDEFSHVLHRGLAAARGADPATLLAAWDCWAEQHPAPAATQPLRCRDPDDQPFIDLALAVGARWLLSRDRAVLALRRPAEARGLAILAPSRWVAPEP